jgi:hypothetical protein
MSQWPSTKARRVLAVGYAHGVIHRDLKPDNVMVGAFGEVQVMDWGLAKRLGDPANPDREVEGDDPATTEPYRPLDTPEPDGSTTKTGMVLGTVAYMAPEQAGGEVRKVDARSDVFGLGAILCQVLTGRPPYSGSKAHDLRVQAVRGETTAALAALDGCGAEPDLVGLCRARRPHHSRHDRGLRTVEAAGQGRGLAAEVAGRGQGASRGRLPHLRR